MLRIGLTGGIGCGKTTVAELFADLSVPVLDADRIARDLVAPGQPALSAIIGHFGAGILKDGGLDRARLRQIVFSDPDQRRWLEALLHPLVYGEMEHELVHITAPYCILVVPLLLETGRRDLVDRLLVVDCPEAVQRLRIRNRDQIPDADIARILASQVSRATRLAAADDVIDNAAGRENLADQVQRLHRLYLNLDQESDPSQPADSAPDGY